MFWINKSTISVLQNFASLKPDVEYYSSVVELLNVEKENSGIFQKRYGNTLLDQLTFVYCQLFRKNFVNVRNSKNLSNLNFIIKHQNNIGRMPL